MILCKHCSNSIELKDNKYFCPSCEKTFTSEDGITSLSENLDCNHEYYPEEAYQKLIQNEASSFWFNVRNKIICQTIIRYLPPSSDIIEVGCGTGFVSSAIKKLGYTVDCADLFPKALSFCMKRNAGRHFFILNLEDVLFIEEYDAVCAFDVIEHIQDDQLALTNMHKILKNEGYVFITVPACPSLWSAGDVIAEHKRRYTMKELTEKVENAGFKICKISYFMSLLFPLLYTRRKISSLLMKDSNCSDQIREDCMGQLNPNPLLNKLLYTIFSIEPLLLRHMNLPIGGSLLCVAQKKERTK